MQQNMSRYQAHNHSLHQALPLILSRKDPRSGAFVGGMCWAQRETVEEGNGQVVQFEFFSHEVKIYKAQGKEPFIKTASHPLGPGPH